MKKKDTADQAYMDPRAKVALVMQKINSSLKNSGRVYLGSEHKEIKRFKTGVLALDLIVGGGLPYACLNEFWGAESTSKSLLALLTVAAIQRTGGVAAWVVGEDGLNKEWARKIGVDVDSLILIEGENGSIMLETATTLLEENVVNVLVIDSIQSMDTQREHESDVSSETFSAGAPQMWARIMRRVYRAGNMSKLDNTLLIAISQGREKIGSYAKKLVPSQIHALLHWKSVSIECRETEKHWEGDPYKSLVVARTFSLRCEKNKTAAMKDMVTSYRFQFRPDEDIPFGVDNASTAFSLGLYFGLFDKAGSWYSGFGIKGQGEDGYTYELRRSVEAMDKLTEAVMEKALT
jgi:recombination protein RecA